MNSSAMSFARASKSAGSVTSLTRPPRSASSASKTRPERHQRSACARPTSFGRNQALPASGTRPRRAKMKPSFAPFATMRTSIGSVMVRPTPTAGPLIAAIDGLRQEKIAPTKPRPRPCATSPAPPNTLAPCDAGRIETVGAARDIRTRAERPARARDDHRAHRVVGIRTAERILELGAHGAGVGIQLVGTIERDDHDRSVDLARDLLIGHWAPLPLLLVHSDRARRQA